MSAAMKRSFENYDGIHPSENELYSQFKYTELKGFDYNGHDGTITRRDPSKIIFENGKYYVWYTYRNTEVPPIGAKRASESTETIPSTDWDLCEIWYATSKDGFTWEEQGVAIPRPPKPEVGWRSVSTTDILKWEGKYYLYYQGFMEASGKSGDYCPVAMSYSDSPDGPWKAVKGAVIENGAEGEWDQYAIHDPYPLVHNGKVYIYYKSAFNRPGNVWVAGGLAIADNPMGPFKKHPLNPVLNSGHEVALFPFKKGVAAMVAKDGNEHSTIQYAEDWVNFEIAAISEMFPYAPGSYVPDAFTNTKDGRGITWGLSHFNARTNSKNMHTILGRFDCDLSRDINDPEMKHTRNNFKYDVYFSKGLSKKQKERY
ncbi:glycoside hydrolase [Lutibacter sp. TH_r2]|nr:glycoside hydrolase [Lutibacter sp. TH_r2]MDV7185889.1 glycoside hydrolase [Lutibacter sp. TH_r2]